MDKIIAIINNYNSVDTEISPGVFYSQKETVDRINRTIAKVFENTQEDGIPKTWFDIITSNRRLYKSRIELDLKTIRAYDTKGDWLAKGLIEEKLETTLEKNNVATTLNNGTDILVDYGSTILYYDDKGDATAINISDIIIDPTCQSIEESEYFFVKKRMLYSDLLNMDNWDKEKVNEVIGNKDFYMKGSNTCDNKVNVFYCWLKEVEEGKQVRDFYILVEPLLHQRVINNRTMSATQVFSSRWIKSMPFYEAHINRKHNRWLGEGVVEMLLDAQERANELASQSRMALASSSTQVWLSNVQLDIDKITEMPFGTIISAPTTSTIQPKIERVDTYERSLAGLNTERSVYDKQTQDIVGGYDIAKGGETPATMPATNAAISDNNSKNIFAYDREQFEIMFEKYLNEIIKPKLIAEYKIGDSLNIEDPKLLKKLNERRIETEVNKRAWNKFFKGEVVDEDLMAIIRQQVMSDMQGRGYKYDANLFDGKEISLKFIASDQQIPLATIQQNTFTILQPLLAKYGIEHPVVKEMLYSWADISGLNMFEMDKAFMEAEEQAQKAQQMQAQQMPQLQTQNEPNIA